MITCLHCGWTVYPDKSCEGCAHAREKAESVPPKLGDWNFEPSNDLQRHQHLRIRRQMSRDGAFGPTENQTRNRGRP